MSIIRSMVINVFVNVLLVVSMKCILIFLCLMLELSGGGVVYFEWVVRFIFVYVVGVGLVFWDWLSWMWWVVG